MTETVYLSILKDDEKTITVEYIPLADGAIEIVGVDVQYRPRTPFETRRHKPRRGLVLDEAEQQVEALYPYSGRDFC